MLNLWEPTGAWEEYRGLIYGGPRRKLDFYGPRHAGMDLSQFFPTRSMVYRIVANPGQPPGQQHSLLPSRYRLLVTPVPLPIVGDHFGEHFISLFSACSGEGRQPILIPIMLVSSGLE